MLIQKSLKFHLKFDNCHQTIVMVFHRPSVIQGILDQCGFWGIRKLQYSKKRTKEKLHKENSKVPFQATFCHKLTLLLQKSRTISRVLRKLVQITNCMISETALFQTALFEDSLCLPVLLLNNKQPQKTSECCTGMTKQLQGVNI